MPESGVLGLTRRELETCPREPDCGPERKRRNIHRTLQAARQLPTLPESGGGRKRAHGIRTAARPESAG